MQAAQKLFDITRDARKEIKKEKEKRKMRKIQTTTINIFLTFTFLYRIICLLLENKFGKLCLYC